MQKIIPPFLLLISAFVMILLHLIVPYQVVIFRPFNYLGITLIISGLVIARTISRSFSKVDTEIHTFKKPRQLVTNGLFKYSRNPIYLSFVVILIGLNILLGSITPWGVVLIFVLVTNYWYIPVEEKNMQEEFGQEYADYKRKVRRWI
jgi:protein-S-isoprenylcysteine O-methyltransferase Ste14